MDAAEAVAGAEEVRGVVAMTRAVGMSGWNKMQPVTHTGNMMMSMVGTGILPLRKTRNQRHPGRKLPCQRHPRTKSPARTTRVENPRVERNQKPKR